MARRDQRAANAAYYKRNRSQEIARVQVRQHGTVELLREPRARPCADCAGWFAPHQMDFDHRPGTVKRFRLTSGGAMLRPTAALLEEAAKCDVVCANCHRIRTWERHVARRVPPTGRSPYAERKREVSRRQARMLDRIRDVPCMDCGRWFPPWPWTSTIDPRSKQSAVTRLVGRASTARILDEVAACDIVCANCHRLRTFHRRLADTVRE